MTLESSSSTKQIQTENFDISNVDEISADVSIDLEEEYWQALKDIVTERLESPNFTRAMHKRSEKNLESQQNKITVEGDEFYASIFCAKKKTIESIKVTFPLFDEYTSLAKCSCYADKYLLEDKYCDHLLTAYKILLNALATTASGTKAEKKTWEHLFKAIDSFDNQTQEQSQNNTDNEENISIKWVIDESLNLTPCLNSFSKDGSTKYYKSNMEDLSELDPINDGTFADWQIIHLFKNSDVTMRISGKTHLELLENMENLYADFEHTKRIKVVKSNFGIKVEKNSEGMTARPTINGQSFNDFSPVGSEAITVLTLGEKQNTLNYFEIDSRQEHDFISSLIEQKEPVPYTEKERLIEFLMKLERKIPISIDEKIELKQKQDEPAKIYVRFTPLKESGFRIDLLVKPNGITPYPPGIGPETLLAKDISGNPVSLLRDFEKEADLAREVIESSTLSELYSQNGSYFYAATEQPVIKTIHSFKNSERLTELITIEWPKHYGKNNEIKEVDEKDLKVSISCGDEKSDLFATEGQIEIDGEILELKDLLDQLKAERRYIELPSSNWAYLTDELQTKLKQLANLLQNDTNQDNSEDSRLDLASTLLLNELAETSEFFEVKNKNSKLKEIIEKYKNSQSIEYQVPSTLKATLRNYQEFGFKWLAQNYEAGLGCVLADDMGLGKTLQTIALLNYASENGASLVVVPTSLLGNWKKEIKKFSPNLNVITFNTDGRENSLDNLKAGDVVLISYGLCVSRIEAIESIHWNAMVLDEAQTVKNRQTQANKSISKIKARWRLGLSGTPIENNLGELWSIYRVVSPGLLSNFSAFRKRFILPIQKGESATHVSSLKKIVAPFILRRLKTDILSELPPKIQSIKPIALSEKERKFYEAARLEAREKLEKKQTKLKKEFETEGLSEKEIEKKISQGTKFDVLGTLMTLRQIAINATLIDPDWDGESAKNNYLVNKLKELSSKNHRSLVFSQFTGELKHLKNLLDRENLKTFYLDGSTKQEERTELVDRFQSGEANVFLISLKAGGTGLNLTAADHVFHVDPWWNPSIEDQASDRAYRMGQTKTVHVIKLIASDTVEEKILDMHEKKKNLSDSILEGSDIPKSFDPQDYLGCI